jgi:integrase
MLASELPSARISYAMSLHGTWPGSLAQTTTLRCSRAHRFAFASRQLPAPRLAAHLASPGLAGIHFHDLRQPATHLTARAGAKLRELMDRMGHSTTRAALIYLHATRGQQQAIADAVDNLAREGLEQSCQASPDEPIWHAQPRTPTR